jgi:uncharacterized protein YycO
MELKPGDLVLVKGTDFIAKAIEDVTHSPYSHVAGIVAPGQLVEAQGFRKVGYQDLGAYVGQADVYTCDKLTDQQRTIITSYVKDKIGNRYDYILIGIELIRYTLHIVLPYSEHNTRICSTLWADAYTAAGTTLCPGIRYPSPGDIAYSRALRLVGPLT